MDFKEPRSSGASAQSSSPVPLDGGVLWAATTFDASAAPESVRTVTSPFDVCHVGVVLRVVVGVQVVVAVGTSFGAASPADALLRWALASTVAFPASLFWLVVACAARRLLDRLSEPWQWAFAGALGALSGFLGQAPDAWLEWVLMVGTRSAWSWFPPMFTGAGLALVGLVWLRQRSRSELPAHAAARLAELQARIRPHFLFNTLNTAIALVQIDPQQAEAVLEDLAELFRQALASPNLRTTLTDEVALAKRYLSIEQLRFGERLKLRWELDPQAGRAELPALILQPLVENAVRHGVEVSPQGGWIVVRASVQAGRAVLTVSNSVPPDVPAGASRGHGIALRNVRQRLRLMHDLEAEFSAGLQAGADARQPAVYVVRVAVPLSLRAQGEQR